MTSDANNKPTVMGVEVFMVCFRQTVQQEAPTRVTEASEIVFYDHVSWRTSTQSAAAYIVRRKRELDNFKELSSQTEVSDDTKAHLLLKLSGLLLQHRQQPV